MAQAFMQDQLCPGDLDTLLRLVTIRAVALRGNAGAQAAYERLLAALAGRTEVAPEVLAQEIEPEALALANSTKPTLLDMDPWTKASLGFSEEPYFGPYPVPEGSNHA